ncbi:MAG: hypothetical protein NVSMB1_04350 [Polyangiales bacterium]
MKESALRPRVHLFVCANRRADDDVLGKGCGANGEAMFWALKARVATRGLVRAVWIAKTHCLGICPKVGCAVAVSNGPTYYEECLPEDADALLDVMVPRG